MNMSIESKTYSSKYILTDNELYSRTYWTLEQAITAQAFIAPFCDIWQVTESGQILIKERLMKEQEHEI